MTYLSLICLLIDFAIAVKLFGVKFSNTLDYKSEDSEFDLRQEIVMAVRLNFRMRAFLLFSKVCNCVIWVFEDKQISIVLLVIVTICAFSIDLIYSITQIKEKRIRAYDIMFSENYEKFTFSQIVLRVENVIFLLMVLFN